MIWPLSIHVDQSTGCIIFGYYAWVCACVQNWNNGSCCRIARSVCTRLSVLVFGSAVVWKSWYMEHIEIEFTWSVECLPLMNPCNTVYSHVLRRRCDSSIWETGQGEAGVFTFQKTHFLASSVHSPVHLHILCTSGDKCRLFQRHLIIHM